MVFGGTYIRMGGVAGLKPFVFMHPYPKVFFIFLWALAGSFTLLGQVNPENVTIIRDNYGIPHIYGKSDADMTYGLVWAACEDDFRTLQESLLASRGKLASVNGKDGAIMDVLYHILQARDQAKLLLESTSLDPAFMKLIQAYKQSINEYAATHPKEVLMKNIFPIDEVDIAATQLVGVCIISGAPYDIIRTLDRTIKHYEMPQTAGSNAFAINSKKSADGSTMLCANSHQPITGLYSWYEAHINSEESGINMYGATFAGGMTLFIGANEHLGWSHTVNFPDHNDTYKLRMHPKDPMKYELDGQWETLEPYHIKLKVKLGPIKIPIKKKFYKSKHGTVIKNKDGYYALSFRGNRDIRSADQWYRMCKATNMEEFKAAMDLQYIPALNTIYADKAENLFFISSGNFAYRDKRVDWTKILPGRYSGMIWNDKFHPTSDLPQITNPPSGYIYNTNNAPFDCTSEEYSLDYNDYNPTFGYQTKDNNRSIRLRTLIEEEDKIDYERFKAMKQDNSYHAPLYSGSIQNIEKIFHLDETKYPDMAESIRLLKAWDRKADPDRKAAIFSITVYFILDELFKRGLLPGENTLDEAIIVKHLKKGQKHLKKHFKKVDVTLGELQRVKRGKNDYPVGGMPDVLAAMNFKMGKKGRLYAFLGDAFYQFVVWKKDGTILMEATNIFGSSNKEGSPHYNDQLQDFLQQKVRKVYLDKNEVIKTAERSYHPGK